MVNENKTQTTNYVHDESPRTVLSRLVTGIRVQKNVIEGSHDILNDPSMAEFHDLALQRIKDASQWLKQHIRELELYLAESEGN
ncbi:MAG: hypothetical protein ACPG7F_03755 [Aggregatilineales bacterium]